MAITLRDCTVEWDRLAQTCADSASHTHTGTTAADIDATINQALYGDGSAVNMVNGTATLVGCHNHTWATGDHTHGYTFAGPTQSFEDRAAAIDKGMALLKSWLSPEQLKSYEESKYFDVIGCNTGTRYRIMHGSSQNVYAIDSQGTFKSGLCFAPKGNLVAGDVMLAQKLALECNEYDVLGVANRFGPMRLTPGDIMTTTRMIGPTCGATVVIDDRVT